MWLLITFKLLIMRARNDIIDRNFLTLCFGRAPERLTACVKRRVRDVRAEAGGGETSENSVRRAPFTSTPLWNKCAVFLKRVMNRVTSHDACITTMVYSPTVMPKPNLWFLFA
jgi:hypothetical protein